MRRQFSRRDILGLSAAFTLAAGAMLASSRAAGTEPQATPKVAGPFKLPDLPYPKNALAPHISAETLYYHHDKHHAAYVNKLNELVVGTKFAQEPLEIIITSAGPGPLFNNAAQHWNHSFYWKCMSPRGGGEPTGAVADGIRRNFGSFNAFKQQFSEAAKSQFGSGWAWLVKRPNGSLAVEKTSNADLPLAHGDHALLTCDVWEHAYYIDYRNQRPKYVEQFWAVVDWDFVAKNYT